MNTTPPHFHFVTGRLAEHAVRSAVANVADKMGFEYSIQVLPITVAALITSKWLLRHMVIPPEATRVILPGYLSRDLKEVQSHFTIPIEAGPRDIRDLPLFFGNNTNNTEDFGEYDIDIIAEINHAPSLTIAALLAEAKRLNDQGANVIDLGCTPGHHWVEVDTAVRALVDAGLQVSIDSFDPLEVANACNAGANLVLSVNSSNCERALDWGAEVVVIPDSPDDEKSFEKTIDYLASSSVSMRLDPILEPIGCGFAQSLKRYAACREQYPDSEMMMGIGNITELTDCDSAGINLLLLAICQELRIESVLTTQVINWARTSVQECDLARRLVHFACSHKVPPKHVDGSLIMLRDERVNEFGVESLQALAEAVRDKNVRIANAGGEIHAVSAGVHVHSSDPFLVMESLLASQIGDSITASHAFYLGFEMAKALTAETLGKQYTQDEALDWGFLTRPEDHHRLARKNRAPDSQS